MRITPRVCTSVLSFNDVIQSCEKWNWRQRSNIIGRRSASQPVPTKPQVRTGSSLEGGIEGGGKGVSEH